MLFYRRRWRSTGSSRSSGSLENREGSNTADTTPAPEASSEGLAESSQPAAESAKTLPIVSAGVPKPTAKAALPARVTSSEHSIGSFGGESVSLVDEGRERTAEGARHGETIERATDADTPEKDRDDDPQLMEERRCRPLYPLRPPIPPAPRPRAAGTGTAPCTPAATPFVGVGWEEYESAFAPRTNMAAQDTSPLALPSHRTTEGIGSKAHDTSPLLRNHRSKEGAQRLDDTTSNEAGEAPNRDGWVTAGGQPGDRGVPPFLLCIEEKQEDNQKTDGKDVEEEDRIETSGGQGETNVVRERIVTAPSAEECRKRQGPKPAMGPGGPSSALCLEEVTVDDASTGSKTYHSEGEEGEQKEGEREEGEENEMEWDGQGGGEQGGRGQRETCIADKEKRYNNSAVLLGEAARENIMKPEHVETEGSDTGGGHDKQNHASFIATDEAEEGFDYSLCPRGDARQRKQEVEEQEEDGWEHGEQLEARSIEADGDEEETDNSYRRDCAVLAGTAKIVLALAALEHRRISSRFYRWKRACRSFNRQYQRQKWRRSSCSLDAGGRKLF